MTGPRLRAEIIGLPAYKPGRVPAGGPGWKLSSNENPYPPLPSVVDAIARAATSANRYPDMAAPELTQALSERHGVDAGCIALGTGSVAVTQQLMQATTGPGNEVVYAWRSFEAYPIIVQIVGGTSVQVPLTDQARHDLDRMAAAVNERTSAVIVCSPNNPTGPSVRRGELEALLDAVPETTLVVLDEAYTEFVTDPDTPDGIEIFKRRSNVAVLRTFSKAYGLAGLRVGYVVAPPEVAAAARATAVPFGVSTIAQVAAVASLGAEVELRERVEALVGERARMAAELRNQGWQVPDAQGNFVWLPTADTTTAFAVAAEEAGVMVRPFPGEGVRVTVGAVEVNDRLLEVAAALQSNG